MSQISEKLKMISKLEHENLYWLTKFLVIKNTEIIDGLINIFCMYDKCLAISCLVSHKCLILLCVRNVCS